MAGMFGDFNPRFRPGKRKPHLEERVLRDPPPPPSWMVKPTKPPIAKKKRP